MTSVEEIFVPLLEEGTDVWRPTQAERLVDGSYRVLPTSDYDPNDEVWQFPPDSRVVCEMKRLSGGTVLAAVRFAESHRRTA